MYILEVNHGGGEVHRHFLLPGQTYTLGRKECRILLPAAEPSISRHHATIVVSPMPRYSVLDPTAQLEIRIEDVSKHGTFVDRERVGKDNTRFLYPEDRIRLGLRVTARIIPMMLILGISPDLTDESLDLILDSAVHIGALVVEETIPAPLKFYEQHTNCVGFLYVAEDNFTMEETMMQALGYGYTLVTPSYIAHLVKCLEEKDTLMPSEFPAPSSPSPASLGLRAVHYRRPAQTFFSVTEFLSIGRPIAADVFQNYTFLVLDESIREVYKDVLKLFGGSMEALAVDAIAQWRSQHPQTGSYPLTTCVLVAESDFRAVSEVVIERGGGRGDFSTMHVRANIAGYLNLYKYGVCLIPEENVHLSLYRNDAKELNTKANACYLQRTSEDVLADAACATATSAEPAPAAAPATAPATAPAAAPATAPATTSGAVTATTPEPVPCKDGSSSPSVEPASSTPASAATSPALARRSSGGATRSSDSPVMPPPATTATHLLPVQARRSHENSHTAAPLSQTNSAVIASNSQAGSPKGVNSSSSSSTAPTPVAQALPSTGATAATASTAASGASSQLSAATTTTAVAATPAAAPPPPTLDAENLTPSAVAPSHLNPNSSNSSTPVPDSNSLTASLSTTLKAPAKAETTSPETSVSAPPAVNATPAQPTAPAPVVAASSSTAENACAARDAAPTSSSSNNNKNTTTSDNNSNSNNNGNNNNNPKTDANVSVARSRAVGSRASHPFNLSLRSRHSDPNNSEEEEGGEAQEGIEKAGPSAAEINGDGDDETTKATVATSAGAAPHLRAPTASSSVRRATSGGGRRPSLGAQLSPVIFPLKSEEVVRPRFRAASGSQQQTAYAAAVTALGRKSVSLSDERPPLAPTEEPGQHLITVEEAQRRSSGAAEPGNQTLQAITPDSTNNVPTAAASSTAEASPPQRPQSKATTDAPTATTTATTGAVTAAPVMAARSSGSGGTGAGATHASVRRGEQRLATAAAPTPRRSVVQVNPALVAAHMERSTSPQHAHLKRFTTPERDVVVHGATQFSKSPPRQRVEAVRITNAAAERRASASRDPEASVPRRAEPEESAAPATSGSMGNRRSVLRRESISVANCPPSTIGSSTRRASSSFHRSDSAQLREMATPYRLITSRVSSSVPRRRSKVYGSVQRHRSPEAGNENGDDMAGGSSGDAAGLRALAHRGSLVTAQRASTRRRRSSPMQGNGVGSGMNSSINGAGGVATAAIPGQIPGLRAGGAAPMLGSVPNTTAESYFRINDELSAHCHRFMADFLDKFMGETDRVTRSVQQQTYMDMTSKEAMENGVERILEFLQYMNSTEPDIPTIYSTSSTRAACHQVRTKSQYALSRIKKCYADVNCKIPPVLTRARAALSSRDTSSALRRSNPAAPTREPGSARRQNNF